MRLDGSNVVILDVETLHSADDCQHCGHPAHDHNEVLGYPGLWCDSGTIMTLRHQYTPIGWDNHAALGLSIGCYFAYRDMHYHFFDHHTLGETMRTLTQDAPLIVSYNGKKFDGPLMLAVLQVQQGFVWKEHPVWSALIEHSHDILDAIWTCDPENKYAKGNSLNAVSQANGFGAKQMDGATAPRLWAQGRYAEVIQYNMDDVLKTCLLFEKVMRGEPILRSSGAALVLPMPEIPQ